MDTQTKEEILEEASQAIEETLDVLDNIETQTIEVVRNNKTVLIGVALVAASTGAVAGYFYAKKKLTAKYEELAEQEIADAKAFYALKKPELPAHLEVEEKLESDGVITKGGDDNLPGDIIRSYQGRDDATQEVIRARVEEVVEVSRNIFVNGSPLVEDEWDYEAEKANRSETAPFIIHKDEFFENEDDYEQTQITYFAGDKVLADEDERTIDNIDRYVGLENLKNFGHGSGDPNLLYIRNNTTGTLYEVVQSDGKYAEEVLGFDTDETEKPPLRKFRGGDE